MVSAASKIKTIKEFGWTHISISKKEFAGAVQTYTTSNNETVAIAFAPSGAFVIEDEQGLFTAADLFGMIKDKDYDMTAPSQIDGSTLLALAGEGEVELFEAKLDAYGLGDLEVTNSLKNRLAVLSDLDALKDMPV